MVSLLLFAFTEKGNAEFGFRDFCRRMHKTPSGRRPVYRKRSFTGFAALPCEAEAHFNASFFVLAFCFIYFVHLIYP